jgi:trimeric autotransporter adhesin
MKGKSLLILSIFILFSAIPAFSQEGNDAGTDLKKTPPYGQVKPLFQVKNKNKQTVFAVYEDGVKIYIDDRLKSSAGGFTVGRLGTGKSSNSDFFVVRPNDVKVILSETFEKSTRGGFTVGRLGTGKSTGNLDYLSVTPNQTRISVNDSVAGFAITNNVNGTTENILYLNKQNYFIGHNTGTQITSGIYNSTFGYQSANNLKTGNNNLIFGYRSGFMNASGSDNIYIGNKSGENSVSSSFNTYLGSESGRNVTGGNNTFLGAGSGTLSTPSASSNNVYVGFQAGAATGSGGLGNGNVCIGFQAGFNQSGSNKLFIANSATSTPLIYGEFDNQKLIVNGGLNVAGNLSVSNNLEVSNLNVGNNLAVNGQINSAGLAVSSDVSIGNNLSVANNLNTLNQMVGNNLEVGNDLSVTNKLTALNQMVGNNLEVGNDLSVTNKLTVLNQMVGNNLEVGNDLSVTNKLTALNQMVGNNLEVGNNLVVTNTLGALNLNVSADISVGNNLTIGQNLVSSYITVNNMLNTSDLTVANQIQTADMTASNHIQTKDMTVTGEFSSPSDMRLKANIIKISAGLDIVQKLSAYYYDWNAEAKGKFGFSEKKQIGLMAQDVEKVLPELVSENFNGFKTVDYTKIVPVLVNAINEQQNTIENLKSAISAMELIIEKLSDK